MTNAHPRTDHLQRTLFVRLLPALLPLLVAGAAVLAFVAHPALAAPARTNLEQETTPVTMTVAATVGTVKGQCGAATSIIVTGTTTVYTCYTVTNTSPISPPITIEQIIIDQSNNEGGVNPDTTVSNEPLAPQAGRVFTMSGYVPTSRNVTLEGRVAANRGPGTTQVEVIAPVTITVIHPAITMQQTLSRSPSECTAERSIFIPVKTPAYRCITLENTGDITLTAISLTVNPHSGTQTSYLVPDMAPAKVLVLTAQQPNNIPVSAFVFTPTVSGASSASVVAETQSTPSFKADAAATGNVTIGTPKSTLTAAPNHQETCATGASLSVVAGASVYYCLTLKNTGNISLTRHIIGKAGIPPVTLDRTIAPTATLIISSGTLAALGLPPILGPVVVTANVNSSFIITSTASGGFSSVAAAPAVSVLASTPTATPVPTATPLPTITPFPTWTPLPTIPTWTPFPTWTPPDTPLPPTPTWTRSFELSNLQTPTPGSGSTADFQATALAQNDPNAYLTPPFDSGLPTPFIDPNSPEQPASPLLSPNVGIAPPLEPTRIPLPTQTPLPTATPTATQRPIAWAEPAPPPTFVTLFTRVLDSTLTATGILFVATGAVVFFGVLATILALGFLHNSRRPYQLRDADGDDADFRASTGARSGSSDDRWPTSLP